ncbi:hypothetical protein [Desulfofustis limnaeus]|uniref:Uncharacterized protein n=1 Tax=Desulfofustis limnaeus TaxID=2740163 RepID=A0ABN6M2A0_9BACT|nr:hypothetical protein [Desulfofustis limnaeus]BDD87019.1 hypothetical protein DPPLL_13840 [Desulfofustis limnaeus]
MSADFYGATTRLLKMALFKVPLSIINIFCVIEAILYGIINDLNDHCKVKDGSCKKYRSCQYFIKSSKKIKFNQVVDLLMEKQVLNLSPENRELLFKYNDMRNNVHIFINKDNEFLSEQYNRKTYNKLVFLLRKMSQNLHNKLEEFIEGRDCHCKKNV